MDAYQHRLRQLLLRPAGKRGRCIPKRLFGGYALSTDGLTIAILADLGDGKKLWLKGDASIRSRYEAAGCKIFTYGWRWRPSCP